MEFAGSNYSVKVWKNEKLGKYIALDTETTIVPFHMTPDLVTVQAYDGKGVVYYIPLKKLQIFLGKHYDSYLILHNAPFDMDVIAKYLGRKDIIYDLYDRCKVRDTGILYRLLHLASIGYVPFKYSLALLTEKFMGYRLDKDDEVRCNFAQFQGKDISEIPKDFLEYGAKDVIATFHCYFSIIGQINQYDSKGTLLSHDIQVKGDLALNHIYKNGIGFDLAKRDLWLHEIDRQMQIHSDILASWGWVRGIKGIKDRYERIINMLNIDLPRTEDGSISSKEEDLQPYKDLQFVYSYLEFHRLEKASSFVRDINNSRIHPRYTTILNTGRTSCSKPNIQQIPRVGGIREMFIPSKGHSFIDVDYSFLELCTLAQVTYTKFGHSKMMDVINSGKDPHTYAASKIYNKPEEEIVKSERQLAKVLNFGLGANMGSSTFVTYAAAQGVILTESESASLKEAWKEVYPEMNQYFYSVPGDRPTHYTLTGRARGDCTYTAYLNTGFQGLAADGFKLALYNLDKEGFKIVAEIHDQVLIEEKDENIEKSSRRIKEIMVQSMREVTPDVKIETDSQVLKEWTK